MFYHLILTDECNLCCRYCRGKAFESDEPVTCEEVAFDPDLPVELDFGLGVLYNFLKKDPEAVVTFYGGEPLLRGDLIHRIVRDAPVQRFMLQTNGTLLHQLEADVLRKFETILVSIDGPKWLTDVNRGRGTYHAVMKNIRYITAQGFEGEIIARMTVTEKTDIFKAVIYLSNNNDFSFSSVHWQIDANFWHDFHQRNFSEWVETSYNPGIKKLMRYWISQMRDYSKVLHWYPFLDPLEDLLAGSVSRLRCGAGYANYSIMTDGSIAPCPVMVGMKDHYLGHIRYSNPADLQKVAITGRCEKCKIAGFCGGRCLYSNITRPWNDQASGIVCNTVENLYQVLTDAVPVVSELLNEGGIPPGAFSHTKFNGCEIIP
jgi:uncharacterized protein